MTVCRHDDEFLCCFVCDLEYTVHIWIAEQLDQAGTLGRIQTDFDGRCSRIRIREFECEEITRAPITRDRAGRKFLECTCDLVSGYGDVVVLDGRNRRLIDLD